MIWDNLKFVLSEAISVTATGDLFLFCFLVDLLLIFTLFKFVVAESRSTKCRLLSFFSSRFFLNFFLVIIQFTIRELFVKLDLLFDLLFFLISIQVNLEHPSHIPVIIWRLLLDLLSKKILVILFLCLLDSLILRPFWHLWVILLFVLSTIWDTFLLLFFLLESLF